MGEPAEPGSTYELMTENTYADVAGTGKPGLRRYLPILEWLPSYDRKWLAGDAVAGLTVWSLLIPQALAYATLAGVPVEYGLYTAFAALIAYPLFGTSRQLVEGPSAAVCAVSAAVITPIVGASALGTQSAVGWSAALALATGAVYVVLGLLRMGWVSTFLSKAVMAGFVLGFSIGIIIDQSYKLIGVPAVDGSYIEKLWGTVKEIPDTSLTTLAVGAGSLGLLLLMRHFRPRWPRMLMVVALAIVASSALDLSAHGVAVTGDVPTGLFSVGTARGRMGRDRDAACRGAVDRLRRLLGIAGRRPSDGAPSTATRSMPTRS